uniref:Uncharacterized protein n=1 Tax=Globisporangium ultimum (strain ATCC 200006 / CBS 805.95 / DAOM BR144) TaxID=431595 RepID=K3WI20_GLOUD
MDLSQAVGIVTGGASGFGKAFAEKILAAGGKVLITDVNGALLETTGKELQAKYGAKNIIWTRQNVTDAGGFVAAFDKASKFFSTPVNLLVNNAGIAGDLSFFDDGAPRNWEKVINIDLFALIRGTQVAMDNFKKHLNGREGVVVNLASLAGLNPVPFSPDMELSQVVGIVTGAAVGLGRGFAEAILASGGKVLITDIDATQLEKTGAAFQTKYGHKNVGFVRQNVTDPDSFHVVFDYATKYFERAVNMLVNNAGIGGDTSFYDDGAPRNWEKVITIDLTALIRGTQVAIDYFKKLPKGQEGVVVNLASLAGLNAVPFSPEYGAAKAGVVGFTRSLYQLKKSHNIRVVALCPGFAKTAMGRQVTESAPDYAMQMGGIMEVGEVVNAFVAAVKEPDNAGRCLRVFQNGLSYYKFAGDKFLFPNSKL